VVDTSRVILAWLNSWHRDGATLKGIATVLLHSQVLHPDVRPFRREKIATKVCQKQGAASRRTSTGGLCACEMSATKKASSGRMTRADEAVCLSRGREKRRGADFKSEAGGTAQSFRDQD